MADEFVVTPDPVVDTSSKLSDRERWEQSRPPAVVPVVGQEDALPKPRPVEDIVYPTGEPTEATESGEEKGKEKANDSASSSAASSTTGKDESVCDKCNECTGFEAAKAASSQCADCGCDLVHHLADELDGDTYKAPDDPLADDDRFYEWTDGEDDDDDDDY